MRMTVKKRMQQIRNEEMTSQVTKAVKRLEEMFCNWQEQYPLSKKIELNCRWEDGIWLKASYASGELGYHEEYLCNTRSSDYKEIERKIKKKLKKQGFRVCRYIRSSRYCMSISLKLS